MRGNEYSRFHGYTYDGIWAAALAIQYVAQKREDFLTHFDYRVKEWESVFLEALRNTSFEGVTVNIGLCINFKIFICFLLGFFLLCTTI